MIFNLGGLSVKSAVPSYTFSGTATFTDEGLVDGIRNWEMVMSATGDLAFDYPISNIDVFILAGGGSGANTGGTAVGGGGYYKTLTNISVTAGTTYKITVGTGATTANTSGGSSSAFGTTASGGGPATAGSPSYATCKCYGTTGTAGNVYQYNNTTASGSSIGSGYINLDLVYPLKTVEHEDGTTLYVGKTNYYRCIVDSVIQIYYNAGTNGTGASSTKIFGTGDTVSGPGDASAKRKGQGGGSSTIKGGDGLVVIRNSR